MYLYTYQPNQSSDSWILVDTTEYIQLYLNSYVLIETQHSRLCSRTYFE